MMRVGLISLNGQARDAVGNHLAEKLGFFADRGADVRVFLQTAHRLHPALARHVQVVDKVEASGPAWEFLKDADLVIADFAQAYDLLHFLPLLAGNKPRLVLEYHGITPPRFWSGPQRAALEQGLAQRGLVWCADYALVHSRFAGDELVRPTGFPRERVLQLDFPLDERLCAGPARWSVRDHLGVKSGVIILYVGRLAVSKRVPTLIEALAKLRDSSLDAHLVIVGDATDVYAEEERRCRDLALQLGIARQVHFLGSVADDHLADCYRAADVLVIPSEHEGFCVPVVEAMACGLPVIAARSAALPETVGAAGITFTLGDAGDLAGQIRRVILEKPRNDETARQGDADTGRVALVSFRFGAEIVGGAETSLGKIAHALNRHGRQVEVFTTCTRAESDWSNELPAGSRHEDGLLVHRFPIDCHDRQRHLESVRKITSANGQVAPEVERAYLDHSIHSQQLLAALGRRIDEFDAIVVGPYLFGLTHDIARAFPDKTLLLACFHQEPLAHLQEWPKTYGQVGGIFYHSPEEQELAQGELGINHPGGVEIGTYLEQSEPSSSVPAWRVGDEVRRYVVYCGRYSRQKELPRLLEFASRYQAEHPGRFTFVFMGQGEIAIPRESWARNLGRVDDGVKQAVLAGAAALVQLSKQESLSLVVLEAWAAGTPVLIDRRCGVLAGQVGRSHGGVALEDFATFADALNDLWACPEAWKERGRLGQAYAQKRYGSESAFANTLLSAIAGLRLPLRHKLRQCGLERAEACSRARWRDRFGLMVEQMLDADPRPRLSQIAVTVVHGRTKVKAGTRSVLVPVRLHNQGTVAACADGPARVVLWCDVGTGEAQKTRLSGLLMPGKTQTVAVTVRVPGRPGEYLMRVWMGREFDKRTAAAAGNAVLAVGDTESDACAATFLETAQQALVEIEQRRELPDDYLDVTCGRLARWKRWIKHKLLGNFKRGYVDVLSRQQSQVNSQILLSLQQLTECCATLDHVVRSLQERIDSLEDRLGRNERDAVRAT
jgi:glycosyltransferase involved in cell wall biosynthesis